MIDNIGKLGEVIDAFIATLVSPIWDWLHEPTPFLVFTTLLKIAFAFGLLLTFAAVLVWQERRQSAMIQDRLGPTRANLPLPFQIPVLRHGPDGWKITWTKDLRLFGLLHSIADSVKMIWKEDFTPPNADRFLFAAGPIIAVVPALATFAVIPFGDVVHLELLGDSLDPSRFAGGVLPMQAVVDGHVVNAAVPLQIAPLDVGVLYIFAVAGTGVIGAAIAGYASDNKFSLLGGIRAASQMVSYEVTLGLALVPMFMLYGTLRLDEMVQIQAATHWGIFKGYWVVGLLSLLLFFTASVAEAKRVPFDVPEGESEIVGGYMTEYSSLKFGMFFTGEFIEVVVASALIVTIFFGGYLLPGLDRTGFSVHSELLAIDWSAPLAHWAVTLIEVLTFLVKLVVVVWFQLMVRWTVPRFRYDQIMKLCWRMLLPASLATILVTGALVLAEGEPDQAATAAEAPAPAGAPADGTPAPAPEPGKE